MRRNSGVLKRTLYLHLLSKRERCRSRYRSRKLYFPVSSGISKTTRGLFHRCFIRSLYKIDTRNPKDAPALARERAALLG